MYYTLSDQLAPKLEPDGVKTLLAQAETSLSLLHFAFQLTFTVLSQRFPKNKAAELIPMATVARCEMTGIRHMPRFAD